MFYYTVSLACVSFGTQVFLGAHLPHQTEKPVSEDCEREESHLEQPVGTEQAGRTQMAKPVSSLGL